jgi:hypothetical protein
MLSRMRCTVDRDKTGYYLSSSFLCTLAIHRTGVDCGDDYEKKDETS